jgi:hypothetical protein
MVCGMRVRLYRNLSPQYRKQRAWILKAADGSEIGLGTVDGAVLSDATFHIKDAGRKYVIKAKRRFVHAWVEGTLVKSFKIDTLPVTAGSERVAPGKGATVPVTYNPFTMKTFTRLDCMEPVHSVALVVASPAGFFAKLPKCGAKRAHPLSGVIVESNYDNWNG